MARKPEKHEGPAPSALTVRHFCQGIGDCHLLTFRRADGSAFRMLIDCGIHRSIKGGSDLVREIVASIRDETGGRIDVLAVTHEHWDHVSGFLTAADLFEDFSVGEVWMAWTENPDDPDAAGFDTFRTEAMAALRGAALKLDSDRQAGAFAASVGSGLQALLGFQFGAAGERVRAARDAAAGLSPGKPIYMDPKTPPVSIAGLPNLRIYVLGPPRSREALKLEEKASEMYPLSGSAADPLLKALSSGLAAGTAAVGAGLADAGPFDPSIGTRLSDVLAGGGDGETAGFVRRHYCDRIRGGRRKARAARDQRWRRIDADWLGVAADLAMQLDRGVNNTSLVLAFEMVDTGRVFLFPGDAQAGSWLSWRSVEWPVGDAVVKGSDLMARTVYLKVAHHGSHDATLEENGLDLMVSPHLSAFVPTNKDDAGKVKWKQMPYDGILTALAGKTSGRVIRADDGWLAAEEGKAGFAYPSGSIQNVRSAVRGSGRGGLWVEVDLA